jgi:pilus assembly protein TadC
MTSDQHEKIAVQRHFLISLSRFVGIGILMFGIYLLYGKQDIASPIWGYAPVLIGFLTFFFAPPMLAKRWSSNALNNDTGDKGDEGTRS